MKLALVLLGLPAIFIAIAFAIGVIAFNWVVILAVALIAFIGFCIFCQFYDVGASIERSYGMSYSEIVEKADKQIAETRERRRMEALKEDPSEVLNAIHGAATQTAIYQDDTKIRAAIAIISQSNGTTGL